MRRTAILLASLLLTEAHGADPVPKASGVLDGQKIQFPEKGIEEGTRATLALLKSCGNTSEGTADDLKKALAGDHIRLVFPQPVKVYLCYQKFEVTEVILTQPLNTGVFWLRVGDKVVRCSKYQFEKIKDFTTWRDQAITVKSN